LTACSGRAIASSEAEFLEISKVLEPPCRPLCLPHIVESEYRRDDVAEGRHDPIWPRLVAKSFRNLDEMRIHQIPFQ
jgi:hypothetical protein